MTLLDFFKGNKKTNVEVIKASDSSEEQILFAETALEIIYPSLERFGFVKHQIEIKKYSSTLIFKKNLLFIKINSSNYPTDYPYFYNIILGKGDNNNFFESEFNSIPLWKLKIKIDPTLKAEEYSFPYSSDVKSSLLKANDELLKYGDSFLNGDLKLFRKTRSEQNKERETFKIYIQNENGQYEASDEQQSLKQKNKFS